MGRGHGLQNHTRHAVGHHTEVHHSPRATTLTLTLTLTFDPDPHPSPNHNLNPRPNPNQVHHSPRATTHGRLLREIEAQGDPLVGMGALVLAAVCTAFA